MIIMKINWKVRFRNKYYWLTVIPAGLLLIQVVAALFGFTIDVGDIGNKLVNVVNALFAFLAIIGVNVDVTTKGIGDSEQALTYEVPKG